MITWESQQTDYPTVGPDSPEYEPRGCPRVPRSPGTPTADPHPVPLRPVGSARGLLAGQDPAPDPVDAWAAVVGDEKTPHGISAGARQGRVGPVLVARGQRDDRRGPRTRPKPTAPTASSVSPIPAMSMASHAAGSRFISLMGGRC